MAISFNNALGIHEQAVRLRTARAEVIAGNLANADTPNFKARDIDFRAALKSAQSTGEMNVGLNATHALHLGGGEAEAQHSLLYRIPTQASVDGNTVDEHLEHAAFMENSLAFQASFTLLNKKFRGLMTAIRGE